MKSLYLKVTTIRHLNESDYQKYKKEVDSAGIKVDWDELEKYGLFVERTALPDEDVASIYELGITEIPE